MLEDCNLPMANPGMTVCQASDPSANNLPTNVLNCPRALLEPSLKAPAFQKVKVPLAALFAAPPSCAGSCKMENVRVAVLGVFCFAIASSCLFKDLHLLTNHLLVLGLVVVCFQQASRVTIHQPQMTNHKT